MGRKYEYDGIEGLLLDLAQDAGGDIIGAALDADGLTWPEYCVRAAANDLPERTRAAHRLVIAAERALDSMGISW